ncbi:aspartic endopeptidase Pep1 [Sphaerosporella brunnea]|uniref:Aspartic endopeptidase Pep1 n=1 Tax=Sphaerosporella brunnea TaxID=1250544 RepID=A0A5J5EYT8_9PEZI|nr:aspartic endopeptidase Pep1 [Sphaerosporella brunnea]
MVYIGRLAVAVAAFLTAAEASPIIQRPKNSTFSIQQISNPNYKRNGTRALQKAYAKYGITKGLVSVQSSVGGDVTATPESDDNEYLCPVTIGGQTLNLDFDSGSSDLWVFSTSTPSSEQQSHTIYNPAKSSTFKELNGFTWQISYGDGSGASGTVGTDTVTVGGLTVKNQAVELATAVSSEFVTDSANNGLLGLAWSNLNTVEPTQQQTFFANAGPQLQQNVFTADLRHDQPGSYDFGFIDTSKFQGNLNYVPVDNSQGFWQFTVDGYAVGDGATGGNSFSAIADTGTTLLLLDDNIVSDYYSQISSAQNSNSAGGFVFDCTEDVPDLTLQIGDYAAVVPGSLLNFSQNGDGTCFGGIQSDGGQGFAILGDVFLKAQFTVFDQGNVQLGFAPKA